MMKKYLVLDYLSVKILWNFIIKIKLQRMLRNYKLLLDLFKKKIKILILLFKKICLWRNLLSKIIKCLSFKMCCSLLKLYLFNFLSLVDQNQVKVVLPKLLLKNITLFSLVYKKWWKNYLKEWNFLSKILLKQTKMVM